MLGNLLAESVTTPAWKSKEQGFVGGGKDWQAEALLLMQITFLKKTF
jgi:hypothetical protein